MKFIKQTSTNKIVYRESPHTDKTLANAVMDTDIPESDLEVVDQNLTNDEWTVAMNNQLSYGERRKTEYPSIPEQLDYIYHNGIEKWKADMILPVKEKYPKGDS